MRYSKLATILERYAECYQPKLSEWQWQLFNVV